MKVPIAFESNGITYRIFFPTYPVSVFVDHFVVMQGHASSREERLFPNNKTEIFFNLGDAPEGRLHTTSSIYHLKESVVSGVRNTYFSFKPGSSLSMAGLRFTLFGFHYVFGMPAHEFKNQNYDTRDVWGQEMEWVREQLLVTPDLPGIIGALNDWILSKLSAGRLRDAEKWRQVEQKIKTHPTRIKPFLSEVIGYSHKHSVQLLKEKSGLPPKTIQKIYRFESVLQRIGRGGSHQWADLVEAAGYADQSHMIREFRHFTGYTPAEYVSLQPKTFRFYRQLQDESRIETRR